MSVWEPPLSSFIGVMRKRAAKRKDSQMATQARERIGQDLRERYPVLQELPRRLLKLVRKLDAIEGNHSPEEFSLSWLKQLDAIEGDHLLRACKKRLGSRNLSAFTQMGRRRS